MTKIYTFILFSVILVTQFCSKTKDDKKIIVLSLLYLTQRNPLIVSGPSAIRVYGQNGSFSSNSQNNGGITANSLYNPANIVLDSSGGVYISEFNNNRVLYYPSGSTTATRVYGQNGSFTSNTQNNGGISANSLFAPLGLAIDSNGGLYVSEYVNNRVLYYPSGTTTALRVYGQSGSFTSASNNNGGITANSLSFPGPLALDSSGGLYVSDSNNSRVLYYPSGTTTATKVYGRNGSFTSNSYIASSENSLSHPLGLVIDSSGALYVADTGNNRILYYPSGSTTATRVYGQNGSMTGSASSSSIGLSSNSLSSPNGLALDSSGGLYISDYGNNRVLYFPSGNTTATKVYGQSESMFSNAQNYGGVSSQSLNSPSGITIDSTGRLYIADTGNNRVLYY